MPELFLELFSEEIPARMQARAAEDLSSLAATALAALRPDRARTWHGPRRIALALQVAGQVEASETSERGPRVGAPEQAMAGFLRKHRAERADLREEGEYWVLERRTPAVAAADLIGRELPALLRRFPWPKSMRWGRSALTWVRPLRRILCLLDGAVVPFALADGADAAHGLAAGRLTEGHRFLAPGPCAVEGADDWATKLRARHVMADAAERRGRIRAGLAALAADRGLTVVPDDGLLTEVAGLVEWPVPFLGRIDKTYMDLPPEVLQVSMRVNQRTFAMRDATGAPAPWFGFVANIEPADGGAATIAGNERVLRARFADARHFWDLDRRVRLSHRMAALEGVTFHAKLGTQWQRTLRIVALAQVIGAELGADADHARLAALLCKADLTTGMVGEFPELQGIMGGYYAAHDGDPAPVAAAIRDHYLPKGPSDPVPTGLGAVIALADKIDQLLSFFSIGEKPTGSGDPYALRRAGLGIIRIVIENGLRLRLLDLLRTAEGAWRRETGGRDYTTELCADVFQFLLERLRVMLRNQGARHDVLNAVITDDRQDLTDLMLRTDAIAAFLATPDGHDLLTGYRRAANILRIEEQKDGRYEGTIDRGLLREPEEYVLAERLADDGKLIAAQMAASATYPAAMATLSQLRAPLDAFFNRVTVNAAEANLRRNRLALLSQVRSVMDRVADFSRIEG